jgi:hypothetical protein
MKGLGGSIKLLRALKLDAQGRRWWGRLPELLTANHRAHVRASS